MFTKMLARLTLFWGWESNVKYCGNGQESSLPLRIIFLCSLQVSNTCGSIKTYGAGVSTLKSAGGSDEIFTAPL